MKRRQVLADLHAALRAARMERASFSNICNPNDDCGVTEKNVTEFIKERTRRYRESWIIGPLELAIAELERSK